PRATISMVPQSNPPFVNVSSIHTKPISCKLPLIKTTPTALIYHGGRIGVLVIGGGIVNCSK
ncbi:unnamed protein product, partial [Rotaria sp. Silwood1]